MYSMFILLIYVIINIHLQVGNKTFEVNVVYNNERCAQVNRQLERNGDKNDKGGGTIALTVGLVLALVGLFTAAFMVFLKWRLKATSANKQKRYTLANFL